MVNEAIVPDFNIDTQVFMTLNLFPAQNELQGLIDGCILAFGGCCVFLLRVDSHLAGSAEGQGSLCMF